MNIVLKQLLGLLACVFLLYAGVLGLTLLLTPSAGKDRTLDTATAGKTFYATEPKYVFLNRSSLRQEDNKVILVGASNTVVGFRQPQLASLVSGASVGNLAVGGANFTEVSQIVDLVQEMQSEAARRRSIFVVGMWYGMFAENRYKWYTSDRHPGDTDIDIERYRYFICGRGDQGPSYRLPLRFFNLEVNLVRPYLVLDWLSRELTNSARGAMRNGPQWRTEAERNAAVVSDSERRDALSYWRQAISRTDSLAGEQFDVLHRMLTTILDSGARVVLVDLPLPQWHEQESPYMGSYRTQRDALVADFKSRGNFAFMPMLDLDADLDYSDEVHPKPRVTIAWSERLAATLNPLVAAANSPALPQAMN